MIPDSASSRFTTPLAAAVALIMIAACSPNPGVPDRPPSLPAGMSTRVVQADWDDIPAAISRASSKAAVASKSQTVQGSGQRGSSFVVTFIAIDGQPATAVITAESDWTLGGPPADLQIKTTFGEPNDSGRAAALASELAHALSALAGRSFAPAG